MALAASSPSMPKAMCCMPSTATRASAKETSGCSVPTARTCGRATARMLAAAFVPDVCSRIWLGRSRFSLTSRPATSGMRSSRTEMMMMSDSEIMSGMSPVLATTPEIARAASDSSTWRPCKPDDGEVGAHEPRGERRAHDPGPHDEDRRRRFGRPFAQGAGVHFGFGHVAGHAGSL